MAADETAPLAPSNRYERSKAAAEGVAQTFIHHGRSVIIARPEFIYGPGDKHVLGLFKAIQSGTFFYVSGGGNSCHPTYIDDAVDGLLRCLQQGTPGETYHIAGPRPVTFRELGETIAAALGVRAPRLSLPKIVAWAGAGILEAAAHLVGREPPLSRSGVAFFSQDRRFSWEKARISLAYHARFSLAAGVGLTVAWYREQGLL
jgi:nucleoside-diphosphate-sugar epimerase